MMRKQAIIFLCALLACFSVSEVALARSANDPNVSQWAYTDLGIFEAWDYTIGSKDVIVGIIDNGFDSFHPDLRDNVWKNTNEIPNNGIDDDNNGYIDDVLGWNFTATDRDGDGIFSTEELQGNNNPLPDVSKLTDLERAQGIMNHGTLVAGIIGAVGNNGIAGAGLNWRVQLMNLKVVDNSGSGPAYPLARAIRYAVDNGAQILNISLVSSVYRQEVIDALLYAYEHNVVVIAAVGNNGIFLDNKPVYPACADQESDFQFVLGVSAINEQHYLAPFSNGGASCVDVTAPGVNIGSTVRYAPEYGLTDLYESGYEGTSFAAPFVAGTAALIKSVQPHWQASRVYDVILDTVHRTPPQDVFLYNSLYGHGLLQTNKAVKYAAERSRITIEPDESTVPTQPTIPSSQTTTTPVAPIATPSKGTGTILSIQKTSGLINLRDIASGSGGSSFNAVLKAADDVAYYHTDSLSQYIVSRFDADTGMSRISFFNTDFAKTKEFSIKTDVPVSLEVGDITTQAGLELVLAPQQKAQYVFMVVSLAGDVIQTVNLSYAHTGVSIALEPTDTVSNVIVTHVDAQQIVRVYTYKNLVATTSFPVEFLKKGASLEVGDIDGDGAYEYVIGAKAGDIPYLAYYESNGELLRKFFAYDPAYTGGIGVAIIDYDGDGADDILITHMSGGMPVRIWNNRSKNLLDYYPFGERNTHDIILKTFKVL